MFFTTHDSKYTYEAVELIKNRKKYIIQQKSFILENLVPLVNSILLQGINEKLFDVPYPKEIAEFIVLGVGGMYDQFRKPNQDDKLLINRVKAIELLLKRILGMNENKINLKFK